nr:unnamed protein product [Callosobruchus chinensis]
MLTDSGASTCVINPDIAYQYFSEFIFHKHFHIKALNTISEGFENIRFPMLKDFGIRKSLNFHIVDWHAKFDCLIGASELTKLGAKIDFTTHSLQIGKTKIPFITEINPCLFVPFSKPQVNYLEIPVVVENGPIILPDIELDEFFIPSCIAKSENISVKIPAPFEDVLDINFHEPVECEPYQMYEIRKPKKVPLSHWRAVGDLSLFYRYSNGFCPSKLTSINPPLSKPAKKIIEPHPKLHVFVIWGSRTKFAFNDVW